ncbi:MAG: aspartate kinase [Myxococcales bacterium]|nr:aspartate kinase [Myxococcales bacterium]
MAVVVQKYGGSSVADVERIRRVAQKIVTTRRAGDDVVVVVSAMGKTTDELLALAHAVDANPPRRELDMLLSTGERISMALLSMAIQSQGCSAISFTGSQSGIITNDRHFDAKIIEVRPHRVEDELSRGRIVIIAGYQGMSYKREITTLGRGGSDTTALAMAAALGAERAEIYSDVDGVYSADPRIVPGARHLGALRYEEMQEMAAAGAKVLHGKAVEHARRAGIHIHARASFGGERETVVSATGEGARYRASVGQKGVLRIELEGEADRLIEALAAIPSPLSVNLGSGRAVVLVARGHLPDWGQIEERLGKLLGSGLRVQAGLGTAALIGEAAAEPGAASIAMQALRGAGLEPQRVFVTPLQIRALLPEPEVDRAVQLLHRRFLEDGPEDGLEGRLEPGLASIGAPR